MVKKLLLRVMAVPLIERLASWPGVMAVAEMPNAEGSRRHGSSRCR